MGKYYPTLQSFGVPVTLVANNGTGDSKAVWLPKEDMYLPDCDYTKKGSNFSGWNTAEDGSGTAYPDGAKVNDGDILYAQWEDLPLTVDEISSQQYTGNAITPDITVKAGEEILSEGTDYTLAFYWNVNVGVAFVYVKGRGIFEGREAYRYFNIIRAESQMTAPAAKNLIFTGEPQELVTPGTAKGGKMLYALSDSNIIAPEADAYSEDIPTVRNAGNYHIWYYVKGDDNHRDTVPESVYVQFKETEYKGSKNAVIYVPCSGVENSKYKLPDLPEEDMYYRVFSIGSSTPEWIGLHDIIPQNSTTLVYNTTAVDAGTEYDIDLFVDGGSNYKDYYYKVKLIASTKTDAGIVIEGGDRSINYTENDLTLNASVKNAGTNGIWTWTACKEDGSAHDGLSITNDGKIHLEHPFEKAVIKAHYESDDTVGDASFFLKVVPKPVELKWSDMEFIYDGQAHKPAAATADGNPVKIEVNGEGTNAGTYTATATLSENGVPRYTIKAGQDKCDFTIKKRDIKDAEITLGGELTYNGTQQTQAVTQVKVGDTVLDPSSYMIQGDKVTNAGVHTLMVFVKEETDNYGGYAQKEFTVARKQITPAVTLSGNYIYTGSPITPEFIVDHNGTGIGAHDYDVNLTDNLNAGTGKLTISQSKDGNYGFEPKTVEFTIEKADHEDMEMPENMERYGRNGEVNINSLIEEGGSLGSIAVTDNNGIFDGKPVLSGGTLQFKLIDDHNKIGRNAVIVVPVSGCRNYKDYKVMVTIGVTPDENYAEFDKKFKEENGTTIPVSSNIIVGDDGSTETKVTVGGKEVSEITVDKDGNVKAETSIWISGLTESYRYTGEQIKPEPVVYDGTQKLEKDKDYTLSYKNNTNVTAGNKETSLSVKFKGNYRTTPAKTVKFKIEAANLGNVGGNDVDAAASGLTVAATGREFKPVPVVTWTVSGKSINKNNFTYTYYDPAGAKITGVKAPGIYTVVVSPKNPNFTGSSSATITVTGKDDRNKLLSRASVKINTFTYTALPITPGADAYSVKLNGKSLKYGTDFNVKVLGDNVEPGKVNVMLTALPGSPSGCIGEKTATFTIKKGRKLLPAGKDSAFSYRLEEKVSYAKGGTKPQVIVKDGNKILTPGEDYTLNFKDNKAIAAPVTNKNGKVTGPHVVVKGKGKYKDSVTLYFTVIERDITQIAENGGSFGADDKAVSNKGCKKPVVTIIDTDGRKLKSGTDFYIVEDSYALKDAAGNVKDLSAASDGDTVTVSIAGKGKYKGSIPVSYRYVEASRMLSKARAGSIAAKPYTGNETVLSKQDFEKLLYTGSGKSVVCLKLNEDYEVLSYSDNIKCGTAKITLKGKGKWGGTRTLKFKITSKKRGYAGSLVGGEWK